MSYTSDKRKVSVLRGLIYIADIIGLVSLVSVMQVIMH